MRQEQEGDMEGIRRGSQGGLEEEGRKDRSRVKRWKERRRREKEEARRISSRKSGEKR